jgi:23S rRNA pseudouridine955/2504/2580 synthase
MQIFKILDNDSNQRLDKFLKKLLPNASLSLIYKLNRKNKIKVNWKNQNNEYRLVFWDEIKIFLKNEEFELLNKKIFKEEQKAYKALENKDIIYEDKELLIINKNAWTIVHPWDFKTKEISLIQQVHDYLWDKLNSLTFKPSLVHRIDKDTSWIVMIAKTKESLNFLLKELQNNKIDKYYLAICLWNFKEKVWIIRAKLNRIKNVKNENKIQIDEKLWQNAITHYKVLKEWIKWKYSLVECKLETGRMHQIRIHLAFIWNPIIWDKTYWDKKENFILERDFWILRQLLHAYKISFIHPKKKIKINLEAKLKKDMSDFLDIPQN